MDLYHNNPNALRRLLNKRQNPCTQIFKTQPSNSTSVPMSEMNLTRNGVFTVPNQNLPNFTLPNPTATMTSPNIISQPQSSFNSDLPLTQDELSADMKSDEEGDNSDLLEKVEKKIKTTMVSNAGLKTQRKLSEEESDHSTACETHSDFNVVFSDNTDFLLSPSMNFQTGKEPSEMKLDGDDDTPIKSGLIHLNLNPEGQESTSQQENIHQVHDNSNSCPSKIKVRCKLNHQWDMEVGGDASKDCPRCYELLELCREFAKKNGGICLNQEYDEKIRYQCDKGHSWPLNHKNARRRWCAQCAKEQRTYMKKKCEEEKQEREKQEEEFQKKLFEEAKKKAAAENASQSNKFMGTNNSNGVGNQRGMTTLEYLQRVDYEIETLAKKYTLEFMSQKTFVGDLHYQQILQVYKIMIMPEQVLQTYMFNLNAETLRSEFRRMAKIVHPDKNKHPQAGNAFQKIYKVYEVALSRFEGIQQKI